MATTFSNLTGIKWVKSPTIIIQARDGGASSYGFATVNNEWVFGTVVATYAGCLTCNLDDIVFFDLSKATRFLSVGINYYCVDEAYVFFAETPVL